MMKKGISIILALIMILSAFVPVHAYAAEETAVVKPAEAYFQDGTLYVFSQISDTDKLKEISVDISVDGMVKAKGLPFMPVKGSAVWIHYFLLLDVPADMESYSWAHVEEFAETLFQPVGQPVMVSMAVMGASELFIVTPQNKREVGEAVIALKHNASNAPRAEVWNAGMQYCSTLSRQPGELMNLVLLTPHSAQSAESTELDAAWLEQTYASMPDKIHHLVHLETPNPQIQAGDGFGTGTHAVVSNMGEAKRTAEEIANDANDLFYLSFTPDNWNEAVEHNVQLITGFADSTDMEISTISGVSAVAAGMWIPIDIDPNEPEATEETLAPEETEPVTGPTEAAETAPQALTHSSEEKKPTAVMVAVGAGLALLFVVILIAAKGKKKPKPQEDAIPMRLEVISGKCKTSQRKFYLLDELFVGSGKACDVIIKGKGVAEKNCRIYTDGQFVWIEDLNEKSNTSIDGMKIYAPNRLRSGSKLTVGNACIRFLF